MNIINLVSKEKQIFKLSILLLLLLDFTNVIIAQDIYKTPYGKKYHLSTCRMVKNVSLKLNGAVDIEKYDLTSCEICKPPKYSNISNSLSTTRNKAVGVSKTVQCKGTTKKGTRCLHMTNIGNGFCFQHKDQSNYK